VEAVMTDQVLRPDGTGFYLAGGELTVGGVAGQAIAGGQPVDVSVTARLLGSGGMDVTLASWSVTRPDRFEVVVAPDYLPNLA
jgi:hypothetical protein